MAAQHGNVGVVALEILVAVAVDDGEIVVVVLLADETAGVLAEGAHLVLERARIADQLALVEHAVDLLHDLVSALDAHADIDRSGLVGNAVLGADFFQPVRTAAARRHDGVLRADFLRLVAPAQGNAEAGFPVHQQLLAFPAEDHLHVVVAQIVFQREVERLRLLRAEVADRAIDQLEPGLNRAAANLAHFLGVADALDVAVRAEFEVDAVGVVDQILRVLRADERREIAADLVRKGELAIRKRARAGKAGGDVAIRAAVDAVLGDGFRAAALFNRLTLFHDGDVLFASPANHFNRGEDARRTRADDDDIGIHIFLLFGAGHRFAPALRPLAVFFICLLLPNPSG